MEVGRDIPVAENSVATYDEADPVSTVKVDLNGDGIIDHEVSVSTHWIATSSQQESIAFDEKEIPSEIRLDQNYPNPFNPSTQIRYAISEQTHVRLTVYNLIGQQIAILAEGSKTAGWHEVVFDASQMSSGMYIYRLEAGDVAITRKMMLVR